MQGVLVLCIRQRSGNDRDEVSHPASSSAVFATAVCFLIVPYVFSTRFSASMLLACLLRGVAALHPTQTHSDFFIPPLGLGLLPNPPSLPSPIPRIPLCPASHVKD